jgi:glycerophosphoryl diester phosphodiesterase
MTAIYAHRGNVACPADEPPSNAAPRYAGVLAADGGPGGDRRSDIAPGGGAARENTIEAFGAARRAGADGVELDVRLSADDLPVIHHDRRLPDGRDLANIARDVLPHYVPSLEQALAACSGMSVNVEVKHEAGERRGAAAAAAVAGVLRRLEPPGLAGPLPPVLVSSFDEESLSVVRELQPAVPLGLLIDARSAARTGLARAVALGCATLHPFVTQVDASLVAAAFDAGLGLHVWTVNAEEDLKLMADLQVTAVITDRVTAAVRLLRQWRAPNGGGVTG